MQISALYFDGKTSRAHTVTLAVHNGVAQVSGEAERQCPIDQLRLSERFNRAARKVTFPDGAYLEILDGAAFAGLLRSTGQRDGLVVRIQQNWRATLAALVTLLLVLVLAYRYLLPVAASSIADALPMSVDRQIGRGTLALLDERFLRPSQLPAAQREAIVAHFHALVAPLPDAPAVEILFRDGTIVGPNAFALPSGQIVVTDQLVTLLDDDEALMGVLAHELGHVHRRHLMRRLIQSSAIGAVVTVLFGDVSAILVNLPTLLLDMKYSRDIEREADDYAIAMFKANGMPRQKLAYVFEKLARHSGHDQSLPYLASHPANDERIAHILGAP